MLVSGKTALVTGAAHRVGKAIAMGLAHAGADLVIHFWNAESQAHETQQEIEHLGRQAILVQADLSSFEGVRSLFTRIDQEVGGIDIVVNSAAIMEAVDFLDADDRDWQRTMGLNLKGAFFVTQQAAQRMLRRDGGVIIHISDTAGHRPWKRYPIHSMSKAGVEMLTRAAALRFAHRIRVNAVTPGPVLKPESMPENRWEALAQQLPLQRAGSPEIIAQAVLFLIENDFITGESLVVDGGDLLGSQNGSDSP